MDDVGVGSPVAIGVHTHRSVLDEIEEARADEQERIRRRIDPIQ